MSEPTQPRIVLVTGASAGFGTAIARRFAREGARVIATARRAERLEELAGEFEAGRIHPLAFDIGDRAAMEQALASLPEELNAPDLLINNAGLALGMGPAQTADPDDWDRMIDTNVRGLVHLTRALLPTMVERRRGQVINIGSVAGVYPYPGGNIYAATKAFVHQFSLAIRSDLDGTGVRVTLIEPGMCGGTEFSAVRFCGDEQKAAAVYAGMEPLSSEDVAEAVHWAAVQPQHVNINSIELMPTAQSFGAFQVARAGGG